MKGLGIDLCEISRIEAAIAKNDRFLERWYTQEEQEYIRVRGKTGAQSAAAMFAAKEAFLKAVGTGIGRGIALTAGRAVDLKNYNLKVESYVLFSGIFRTSTHSSILGLPLWLS